MQCSRERQLLGAPALTQSLMVLMLASVRQLVLQLSGIRAPHPIRALVTVPTMPRSKLVLGLLGTMSFAVLVHIDSGAVAPAPVTSIMRRA